VKKYLLLIIISLLLINSCSSSLNNLTSDYDKLYIDLKNYRTMGYKSKYFIENEEYYLYQGGIQAIENQYCFAIIGKGFFKFYDDQKNKYIYSRAGLFYIDSQNYLVNNDGFKLIPEIKFQNRSFKKFEIKNNLLFYQYDIDDEISIQQIKFNLFLPIKNVQFYDENNYFIFEKEIESNEYQIMNNFYERSTTKLYETLIRMNYILNHCKEQNISIPAVDTKQKMIYLLLNKTNGKYIFKTKEDVSLEEKIEQDEFVVLLDAIIPFLERNYE